MKRLTLLVMPLMAISFLTSCGGSKPEDSATLCFTAEKDNSTIGYKIDDDMQLDIDIETSPDEKVWTDWDGKAVTLNKSKKIYIRNTKKLLSNFDACFHFVMSGKIAASGNIMSMINYANLSEYCFDSMFLGCSSLTSAPKLPATTLAESCYTFMFAGCSNLTSAPELPATILTNSCYENMFQNCTSLISIPSLPATTLDSHCCDAMFKGCTSLKSVPDLPAKTLENSCYCEMFKDCKKIERSPTLGFTSVEEDGCRSMFMNCTSLITAPTLNTTDLEVGCYCEMFKGCIKLKIRENGKGGTKIFTCIRDDSDGVDDMFDSTGGDFKGTPTAGNTYYWY